MSFVDQFSISVRYYSEKGRRLFTVVSIDKRDGISALDLLRSLNGRG